MAVLEVDVTGWLIARLPALVSAGVDGDTPADLEAAVPFVRVLRAGGSDDSVILDRATVVFHCFAASEQAVNALAYRVRGVLADLIGVVADGAVMTRANKIGGPSWAPYDNTAVRQSVLTMQLLFKTA